MQKQKRANTEILLNFQLFTTTVNATVYKYRTSLKHWNKNKKRRVIHALITTYSFPDQSVQALLIWNYNEEITSMLHIHPVQ